jgi:hypothetical protein
MVLGVREPRAYNILCNKARALQPFRHLSFFAFERRLRRKLQLCFNELAVNRVFDSRFDERRGGTL